MSLPSLNVQPLLDLSTSVSFGTLVWTGHSLAQMLKHKISREKEPCAGNISGLQI